MSQIQPAEFEIEQSVFKLFGKSLTTPGVHQELLAIAAVLGALPQAVWGPGANFVWQLPKDRMVTVQVRRTAVAVPGYFTLTAHSTEWGAVEHSLRRERAYQQEADEAIQLWRIPIDEPGWNAPGFVMTSWASFFAVFDELIELPESLGLVPPDWRRNWCDGGPGAMVINITGPQLAAALLDFKPDLIDLTLTPTPGGPELSGLPRHPTFAEFLDQRELRVPADRLGRRLGQADLAGLLAGATQTGEFSELCGVQQFNTFSYLPQPHQCGTDTYQTELGTATRTQSWDDFLAALSVEPTRAEPPPPLPQAQFRPTMPAGAAVELLLKLSAADPVATLTSFGVMWATFGAWPRGTLNGGQVRARADGRQPWAEFDLGVRPQHKTFLPAGVWRFTGEVNAALTQELGEPDSFSASSAGTSIRRWQVGQSCLHLSASPQTFGLSLGIEPWDDVVDLFVR